MAKPKQPVRTDLVTQLIAEIEPGDVGAYRIALRTYKLTIDECDLLNAGLRDRQLAINRSTGWTQRFER